MSELKKHMILTTKNKVPVEFIIDEEDFELVNKYDWKKYPSSRYVQAYINGQTTSISRLVMNAPKGSCVDHINGDRLDNRKSNLRICKHRANSCNRLLNKNSTTGIKGVTKLGENRFRVKIGDNGKRIHLGVWENARDAAIAYNIGAKILYGEFAKINELPAIESPIEDELRTEIERLKSIIDSGRKGMGIDELESVLKAVEEENEVLTDSLRWRKYPEEKPEEDVRYWVYLINDTYGSATWDGDKFIGCDIHVKKYLPIPPIIND